MHTELSARQLLRSSEEVRAVLLDDLKDLRAASKVLREASRELRTQSRRLRDISSALRESLTLP